MALDLLDTIYLASSFFAVAASIAFGALCFSTAQKRESDKQFFFMLGGFFSCIFLCNIFIILTWLVIDYPYIFSPGDLSWIGAIMFLITANMYLFDKRTVEQKEAVKNKRLPALAAPALIIVFTAVCISLYPQIAVNYLLYYIPTAVLSYYALLFYLAGGKSGIQTPMRPFHLMVLLWIAIQLLHDYFSTLGWYNGYAVHMSVLIWLVAVATPGVYITARKGAGT